jgi:hypothetical protein
MCVREIHRDIRCQGQRGVLGHPDALASMIQGACGTGY